MLGSRCTRERIQALAGVVQCAALVDQMALQGSVEDAELQNVIRIFLTRDSERLKSFFNEPSQTATGLRVLHGIFSRQGSEADNRQLRYGVQMIHLSKQMIRRPDMLAVISAGIDRMENLSESTESQEILEQIGELYQQTISKLSFRIQVQGQNGYLRQPRIATSIRGILFCGIRFAHLWWQQGGTQYDFLFRKNDMKRQAAELLGGDPVK